MMGSSVSQKQCSSSKSRCTTKMPFDCYVSRMWPNKLFVFALISNLDSLVKDEAMSHCSPVPCSVLVRGGMPCDKTVPRNARLVKRLFSITLSLRFFFYSCQSVLPLCLKVCLFTQFFVVKRFERGVFKSDTLPHHLDTAK